MPAIATASPSSTGVDLTAARRQMNAWAAAMGLTADADIRRRMAHTAPEVFVALCYPHAGQRIHALCRFALWSWVVDDELDGHFQSVAETAGAVAQLIRALDGSHGGEGRAVREVYDGLCAGRSRGWQEAVRAESAAWLCTLVTEAALTRLGKSMTIEEFLMHRGRSSNIRTCMHLAEYAIGLDLSPEIRELPALDRARALGAQWCGLYNDLRSVPRDSAAAYRHNAVFVVREQEGCSLDGAVRIVREMATDILAEFSAAVEEAPDEPEVVRLAHAYRQVVRGNYDFHNSRPRYGEPHDAAPAPWTGTADE